MQGSEVATGPVAHQRGSTHGRSRKPGLAKAGDPGASWPLRGQADRASERQPGGETWFEGGLRVTHRLLTLGTLAIGVAAWGATAHSSPEPRPAAQFTANGELVFPADYREWIFLTSGVNMNYTDTPRGMDHDMVDNVFVDPRSWQAYKATGRWPEGTVLVKEARVGAHKGSINKSGTFQTEDMVNVEVHVKDARRFRGGWAFFVHKGQAPASPVPAEASCYACHGTHGALDSTFVQFYPTARPIAAKAGTLDASR